MRTKQMQDWAGGQRKEDKIPRVVSGRGLFNFLNLQFIYFKGKGDKGQQVSR